MFIEGSNNPGNKVEVDNDGKIEARAVSISEQSEKSLNGDAFNINTSEFTLTDDAETPLFFFKNESEDFQIVIPRIFVTFLSSTAGSGKVSAKLIQNITGGTILSATDLAPTNFNFGKSKTPGTILKIGSTGDTFSGGLTGPEFLFTSDNQRQLVPFESIILPRGASMLFTLTPPTGNTSMVVEAGANFYISGDAG